MGSGDPERGPPAGFSTHRPVASIPETREQEDRSPAQHRVLRTRASCGLPALLLEGARWRLALSQFAVPTGSPPLAAALSSVSHPQGAQPAVPAHRALRGWLGCLWLTPPSGCSRPSSSAQRPATPRRTRRLARPEGRSREQDGEMPAPPARPRPDPGPSRSPRRSRRPCRPRDAEGASRPWSRSCTDLLTLRELCSRRWPHPSGREPGPEHRERGHPLPTAWCTVWVYLLARQKVTGRKKGLDLKSLPRWEAVLTVWD
ncbi:unnamed protein product [Rangifer tarandus platyrhynchus]|uniref:Uncharacterized protein n=1 Tax=Rangifer tarandus platyrhynchus TaxID=3082113 RepID=A0AC59YC67_RANTA